MSIPGHEGHAVHEAGGGDDLVSGISTEIQRPDRATDIQRQRPQVDTAERPHEIPIVEIDLDAAELGQLGDLPEHDRRDAPRLTGKEVVLASGQLTGERAEEDVGAPSRGRRP